MKILTLKVKLMVQALALLSIGIPLIAQGSDLHVERFTAQGVNSFVLFDSVGSLIIDTTRSSKDAQEVAKLVRAHGLEPQIIFVTHGHRDHFLGMGTLKKEFPKAKIFVANQEIKNDIVNSAKDAAVKQNLGEELSMYPKSESNPTGFDYENEIQVLKGNSLKMPGGKSLEVIGVAQATEAPHEAFVYSKDLNGLFTGDLVYNGVHLWLAREVDGNSMVNWQSELKQLKAQYGPLKTTIYPGHGKPTDTSIFDIDMGYINDFITVIKKSKSQEEAKTQMIEKYPNWESADFILPLSIKTQFERLKNLERR